jgi:uncharacterized RDD family membrane protein YckC
MSETKPQTYYDLLKVSFYASEDELRRGCESALRRAENIGYGVVPNATERADIAEKRKQIMQAYAMLKDPVRRAKYNAAIMAKLAQPDESAPSNTTQTAILSDANTPPIASKNVDVLAVTAAAVTNAASTSSSATTLNTPIANKPEVIDLRASMQERAAAAAVSLGDSRDAHYDNREYAHLGVRFVAMMIDGCILTLLAFVFVWVAWPSASAGRSAMGGLGVVSLFLLIALQIAYYVIGESGRHRSTWGKRWMGLEVVRTDGDENVSALRAFFRYWLRSLSANLLMIGYIMAFFTERKQALHDLITDSVVLRVKEPPKHWLLIGVALILIPPALAVFIAKGIIAKSSSNALAAAIAGKDRFDPKRATPRRSEVETAYAAATSLQRSLTNHFSANGKWPTEKETSDVISQSSRSEALRDHEVKLMPDGSFLLSLGATAEGTARMVFIPSSSTASAEWNCLPINIDEEETVPQCKFE